MDLLFRFLLHQQPRREAILEVVLALLALSNGGLGLQFFSDVLSLVHLLNHQTASSGGQLKHLALLAADALYSGSFSDLY